MKLWSSKIGIFVLIGALFLSVSSASAETIVLKSGKTVEGKIIEKTDKFVKIDFHGVELTYFNDEIQSIEKEKLNVASPQRESSSVNASPAEEIVNRGIEYARVGNYDEGIAEFNKAITIDPNNVNAYYNRGTVYFNKGNFDQAILDFNKAIEIEPKASNAYLNRSAAYFGKGNYDQAISDDSKVIEIDPEYAEAYISRAVAYYEKKEYDKAWEDVHKAEELGGGVNPEFLAKLKEASGRDK